jgi:uncharacterized membrane protein
MEQPMITFDLVTLIDRPVHDVFTFVTNLNNMHRWQSTVQEIKPASGKPIGVGATFNVKGEMMGRSLEGLLEITEFEPDSKFGYKGKMGPVTVGATMTFRSAGTGTKLSMTGKGEPGGFFKIAEGVLAGRIKGQMENNLARLKSVLESGTQRL